MNDAATLAIVLLAGLAAGFINTLAGSGSLLSLPALIFAGLPANVANATNRVAILLQNVVAVGSFHHLEVLDVRGGLRLAAPALVGAALGAQIAVDIDETAMRRAIGAVMLAMLPVLLIRPGRWLAGDPERARHGGGWTRSAVFFAVGLYGGFIQAGVGIFLLTALVLEAGYDIVRANAVKLLIVLCYTILALGIFIFNDLVDWRLGLVLAAGNMTGAWIGSRVAVRRGPEFVRWLLIVVVILAGSELLGVRLWLTGS